MSAATIAAIGALVRSYPELRPILETSAEDNFGAVFPHLVLADVMRWLAQVAETQPEVAKSIIRWLDNEYDRGSEEVRELIVASGVEMIPDPGQPGAILRSFLGPCLREIDPWGDRANR